MLLVGYLKRTRRKAPDFRFDDRGEAEAQQTGEEEIAHRTIP